MKLFKIHACINLCGLLLACNLFAQSHKPFYPLIPYPSNLVAGHGTFIITPSTLIVLPAGSSFKNEAALLNDLFIQSFKRPLKQAAKIQGRCISMVYDPAITVPEGYHLEITTQQVTISAGDAAGMFMGIQTLRQLLPASVENKNSSKQKELRLPAVTIHDAPAFAWRGMHLDVSRHFFSVEYLKKLLDAMALYKFNKFHLHLTDDQGWRIEIKKYPKLTTEGAWRTFNKQDSACIQRSKENPDFVIDTKHIIHKNGKTLYGGFYTQQQMKDVVAYAGARHIEIIPEIDMPGHMMAAINAYNYLSCDGQSTFGEFFSTPICPCMPATFEFAKDVFTEIMDIFPGRYIHIGGDEVDRTHWANSTECKALMEKEGMSTTAELQSYFIKKMEAFFNSKGRQLIGWDEILEGGVSKTAAIMYWRTWVPKAPVIAAKNGNSVIMSPGNPLYFSEQPDKNSLSSVYFYNPVPAGLTVEEEKNIIGAQANLWAERVPSEKRADYMIMPRMTALAENLWTNHKDYSSYLQRLNSHYARLDLMNINYRFPDMPLLERYVFTDRDTLKIEKPLYNSTIRYTLDSTIPNVRSSVLVHPLVIARSTLVRLAIFKADGSRGDVYDLYYQKQDLAEQETVTTAGDGLICSWRKRSFESAAAMSDDQHPDGAATVTNILVPNEAEAPSFGLQYRGYIDVPETAVYSFYLTCDDGGILKIAGREVVDNDGMHPPREKNGQSVLKKGLHKFALDFVEGGGGYTLKLQYSKNGSALQDIPSQWFKH
jgi:hexosaminidase